MGTNFYAVKLMPTSCNCSNCDQIHYQEQKFHIGKSSAGWVFAVHAEEELNLMTWEAWKDFLFCGQYERIEDEYGYDQTPEQMVDWVENRSWPTRTPDGLEKILEGAELTAWIESDYGKPIMGTFVEGSRYAPGNNWKANRGPLPLAGPNGLLRNRIDGHYCVAHGSGTWEVFRGEFS